MYHKFFNHLSVHGYLGCFHVLAIGNSHCSEHWGTCDFLNYDFHGINMGFPGSSAGKESSCNAGDPSLIPGSGGSPGEGMGYPLQDSWPSLMAQLVKNLPAMWKT